jgi:hypothetical protein
MAIFSSLLSLFLLSAALVYITASVLFIIPFHKSPGFWLRFRSAISGALIGLVIGSLYSVIIGVVLGEILIGLPLGLSMGIVVGCNTGWIFGYLKSQKQPVKERQKNHVADDR